MIALIGGSGFIGTRLARRLTEHGVSFRIIDKRKSETFPTQTTIADVRSTNEVRNALQGVSAIVLLAAEHRDDVSPTSLYYDVNVGGAKNICAAAAELGIPQIVFTSSVAVYGFAPIGATEGQPPDPFNDYGKSKIEAEQVLRTWQKADPARRSLIVVRPTVVFGEQNRGNVYNLLRQIASGRFLMIGAGTNRKSMAYVENVAAFLEFSLSLAHGIHTFNFVDKPDFSMNALVAEVRRIMGFRAQTRIRLPFWLGYAIGLLFDWASLTTGRRFAISSVRVRKFCANSVYSTAVSETEFSSPVQLSDALKRTVEFEFLEENAHHPVFYTE